MLSRNQKKSVLARCRAVVIWIDWYPYHLARFEGMLTVLGRNGEAQGIELVSGIGVHKGLAFREDRDADLHIHTLRPNSNWHSVNKLRLAASLWKSLSRLDPMVVLVPGYYTLPALAAILWAKVYGRGSVLMTETTATDYVRISWRERLKSKLIRTAFDWAITGGAAHVRYLEQLRFKNARIASFYDVVGNERIKQNTKLLREHSRPEVHNLPTKYFLFVGRLAEEKNVEGLLSAWIAYRRNGGKWSLVLAGDGPLAEQITSMVNGTEFNLDVFFVGHKTSRQLIPILAFAKCFVLPSLREPWGLVVNEAMAASLPVIVSMHCGCAEDLINHNENGFLFDPSMQGALTSSLVSMEALSDDIRTRWGQQSASRISKYSPENFGQEIARIADWAEERALEHGNKRGAMRRRIVESLQEVGSRGRAKGPNV